MSLKLALKKDKPIEALPGTGFCPKKKGGRRYQIEVLQEMCRHCTVKRKYRCTTPKEMRAIKKDQEGKEVKEHAGKVQEREGDKEHGEV